MATEETERNKKPPAHEVIVSLLRQYALIVQEETPDASHNPETAASLVIVEEQALALVGVLIQMHIPEKDRAAIVDALRNLPPRFFLPTTGADVFAEIEGDTGGA